MSASALQAARRPARRRYGGAGRAAVARPRSAASGDGSRWHGASGWMREAPLTSGVTLTARASGWAAGLGVFLAVANADLALVTTLPTSCRAAPDGGARRPVPRHRWPGCRS